MKKIGLFGLVSMAIGGIIGSGIFAMVGIGIGLTGRSVCLALLVGGFLNLIKYVPYVFTGGVKDVKGGIYGVAKILTGKFSGVVGMNMVIFNLMLAVFCIAIVEYLGEYISVMGAYPRISACVMMTCFFLISITGLNGLSKIQGVIVGLMITSLLIFILFGVSKVESGFFSDGFFAGGISNFIIAIAILSFASEGGECVMNFFEVAKNPRRTIPLAMFLATGVVALVYFGVGIVGSGVLPVEETSGKMLNVTARSILPNGLYLLFIFGGAVLALVSTVNSILAYVKYPLMQITKDGFLPKALLKTSNNGYPYMLMLLLYIVGVIPILIGLNIQEIVSVSMAPMYLANAYVCFSTMRLPKLYPEDWKKSQFRVSYPVLVVLSIISGLTQLFLGMMLVMNLSDVVKVGSIVYMVIVVAYVLGIDLRSKRSVEA